MQTLVFNTKTKVVTLYAQHPGSNMVHTFSDVPTVKVIESYYEVMRKMCMGIKKGEVIKVWNDNGLIDKDNLAFLQGLSTTETVDDKKWCGRCHP